MMSETARAAQGMWGVKLQCSLSHQVDAPLAQHLLISMLNHWEPLQQQLQRQQYHWVHCAGMCWPSVLYPLHQSTSKSGLLPGFPLQEELAIV